jgi:TIR domain
MGRRSVFISYRRQFSWPLARVVRDDLIKHRFDTFMDVENLDSGEFPRAILSEIEAREHFIVLLQPGSLDHIGEDGDWLRREIAHALTRGRNVVPVTADGFEFRRDLVLPPDVAGLPSLNAVDIPKDYFDAAMEKLRTRFLKMPPKPPVAAQPVTRSDQQARASQAPARSVKFTSAETPDLPAPQLTVRARGNLLRAQLTWSEVPGADEYVLERGEGTTVLPTVFAGDFREVYRGPDRSYDRPDNELTARRSHPAPWHYRVRASASGQAGGWSSSVIL